MTVCLKKWLVLSVSASLSACVVGPDYVRPDAHVSGEFKEVAGWKAAQPLDNVLPTNWWEVFHDARLNALEEQVASANQTILQAQAQYHQAQHLVQSAQSAFFPLINLTGTANRFHAASGQSAAIPGVRNLFGSATAVAWEPDIWGSVSRKVESNTATAQASMATWQALLLSLQATLAQNYVQIKVLDSQKNLLDETAKAYNKTLTIIQHRYAVGMVSKSDVMQAQTQLETIRAQAINLGVQRAKLEHAIAVLIGKTPAEWSLAASSLDIAVPDIPVSLPSQLLERRPDIAAAERKMAAANAQIGVAKAAYYPSLNLAATNGFQTTDISSLFTLARRYWALGPAGAALTIFDGGAKNAQYKQAIDLFDASVAGYRQTVLTGFQEVEDNVAALRILAQAQETQTKAVNYANQTLTLTMNQYQAGTVSYLNVMTAQTALLSNQQVALQLQGEQLLSSVLLIKALGGGWHDSLIPSPDGAAGDTKWTDYLILPLE